MQAVYEDEFDLPANAATCPLPDATCTLDNAMTSAAAVFACLFPGVDFLAEAPATTDDSKDHGNGCEDPLAEALEELMRREEEVVQTRTNSAI